MSLAKEKTLIPIENSQAGSAGSTPVARSKLPTQIQVLTLGRTLKGLFALGQQEFLSNRFFSGIQHRGGIYPLNLLQPVVFLDLDGFELLLVIFWQSNGKVKKFYCVSLVVRCATRI